MILKGPTTKSILTYSHPRTILDRRLARWTIGSNVAMRQSLRSCPGTNNQTENSLHEISRFARGSGIKPTHPHHEASIHNHCEFHQYCTIACVYEDNIFIHIIEWRVRQYVPLLLLHSNNCDFNTHAASADFMYINHIY